MLRPVCVDGGARTFLTTVLPLDRRCTPPRKNRTSRMQPRESVVTLKTAIGRQTLPDTTVIPTQAVDRNRAASHGYKKCGPEIMIEHRLEVKPLAENW